VILVEWDVCEHACVFVYEFLVSVCVRRRSQYRRLQSRHRVLQCVVLCYSVLQCVAVCCSVLQCVSVRRSSQYQKLLSRQRSREPKLR